MNKLVSLNIDGVSSLGLFKNRKRKNYKETDEALFAKASKDIY